MFTTENTAEPVLLHCDISEPIEQNKVLNVSRSLVASSSENHTVCVPFYSCLLYKSFLAFPRPLINFESSTFYHAVHISCMWGTLMQWRANMCVCGGGGGRGLTQLHRQ